MAAPTIKLRRSATANSVPTTAQLALGEVAINTYDGKLFIKKNVDGTESIVDVGANAETVSLTATNSASGFHYITFVDATTGNENLRTDTGLRYVPSTGEFNITNVTAGSATLGSISASGDVSITGSFTASGISTFQSHVELGDNDELRLGDGNDLKLWHNGSNSIINDEGIGDLYLGGNSNVNITNAALSEFKAKFITDGAVELYYDNSKKFETTNTGIDVTGHTETDTLNVSGHAEFTTAQFTGSYVNVDGNLDIADSIRHLGDSNTHISFPSNDYIRLTTSDSSRLNVTPSGYILLGLNSEPSGGDAHARNSSLLIHGRIGNTAGSGRLNLQRGSAPSSGSIIGSISFTDSSNNAYARIETLADAAIGTDDYPGAIVFNTTPDGSASPTEKFRIGSAGQIGLGGANYGSSGQVLTSNGQGSAPTWQDVTASGASTVSLGNTTTDASCFLTFVRNAGGNQQINTNSSNLLYDATTNTISANLTGTASTATDASNVSLGNTTTDASCFPVFVRHTTGTQQITTNSANYTYNASTNTISANTSGNAATATDASNVSLGNTTTDASCFLTFVRNTTGPQQITTNSSNLLYDATTNTISANLTGTASVASTVDLGNTATDTTCFLTFVRDSGGDRQIHTNSDNLTYNAAQNKISANLAGTADIASVASTVDLGNNSTDPTCFPVFVRTAVGDEQIFTNSANYTYDASTNTISANLTGTASTASALATNATGTNLTLSGNLTVNGTTVTLNTTTLDVSDLNITVASGAADSAAADGAGLTVDGASATFNYSHSGTKWVSNKDIEAEAFIKNGGTSSQFLKADGSVDSSTYITSADGGNAATLDGVDSTSFLRSDAADIKTSGNLTFNDNVEVQFGSDNDAQIYHNDTHLYLTNTKGHVYLFNGSDDSDVIIKTDDGLGDTANYFKANGSTGEVQLYHYGTEKLATKAEGVTVTGALTATSIVKSGGTSSQFLKADGSVDSSTYLTSYQETNDLSSAVTWANVPNANITESSVTQHQAALSITESQISDLQTYLTSYTETDPVVAAINGIVKSNGTTISAAVAGTDYLTPTGDGSGLTGISSDLINDTTPQLGGTLDTNGNLIQFGDSSSATDDRLQFGASQDLQIYHDGSNSYIEDTGTGKLILKTSRTELLATDGTEMAFFIPGDAVDLFFNNSKKFSTKVDGAKVYGELECTTLDVDGAADITGNVTLHANLDLQDDDKILLGTGDDLEIYHDGGNSWVKDAGTGALYLDSNGSVIKITKSGASEEMAAFFTDGAVELFYDNSKKFETTTAGATVTGTLTATSIVKSGGTSSQFLMADGSVSTGGGGGGTSIANGTSNVSIGTTDGDVTITRGGTLKATFENDDVIFYGSKIRLNDSGQLRCGDQNDLLIYHDGSSAYFENATGNTLNRVSAGNLFAIQKTGGTENIALFNADGACELYHNNVQTLITSLSGVTVTGTLTATADVTVKGAVRCENSASTERFEILYNETTDSLDFSYFAS